MNLKPIIRLPSIATKAYRLVLQWFIVAGRIEQFLPSNLTILNF